MFHIIFPSFSRRNAKIHSRSGMIFPDPYPPNLKSSGSVRIHVTVSWIRIHFELRIRFRIGILTILSKIQRNF
jgi:hypothetical protein